MRGIANYRARHGQSLHIMINRIHILGASGSGTTTLGRAMAQQLRCPVLRLEEDELVQQRLTQLVSALSDPDRASCRRRDDARPT